MIGWYWNFKRMVALGRCSTSTALLPWFFAALLFTSVGLLLFRGRIIDAISFELEHFSWVGICTLSPWTRMEWLVIQCNSSAWRSASYQIVDVLFSRNGTCLAYLHAGAIHEAVVYYFTSEIHEDFFARACNSRWGRTTCEFVHWLHIELPQRPNQAHCVCCHYKYSDMGSGSGWNASLSSNDNDLSSILCRVRETQSECCCNQVKGILLDHHVSSDSRFNQNLPCHFCFQGSFNADIGDWNVSKVQNMEGMFDTASSFNADISGWDTGKATNMRWMFRSTLIVNSIAVYIIIGTSLLVSWWK